jgi:hypothetical protein
MLSKCFNQFSGPRRRPHFQAVRLGRLSFLLAGAEPHQSTQKGSRGLETPPFKPLKPFDWLPGTTQVVVMVTMVGGVAGTGDMGIDDDALTFLSGGTEQFLLIDNISIRG